MDGCTVRPMQVTRTLISRVELSKDRRATGAGPRMSTPARKPGDGLQYRRYAPPGSHRATTLPPAVSIERLGPTVGPVGADDALGVADAESGGAESGGAEVRTTR